MTPEHFQNLLKGASGLDVASVGASSVSRAVLERQRACGLSTLHTYWDRVSASADELQALVEAVVVPETWFFRGDETFAALARFAATEWCEGHTGGVMRLLSIPCSTGEEPYSMSIALLEAGLSPDRFRIDAIDISEQALARARRAVYGKNSFRGEQSPHRMCHFQDTPAGRRLSGAACSAVDFRRGNVLEVSTLPVAAYDVIFCRNLLIYFDRATQDRAVDRLASVLAPGGLLFVGTSEAGILLNHAFAPAAGPMTFGFRKREPAPVERLRPTVSRRKAAVIAPRRATGQAAVAVATSPEVAAVVEDAVAGLEHATQLANLGRFVEAATSCEAHSRAHGPSAGAFYVLGLVRDACGNVAEAAMFYRKALYLNPRHEEALVHLALLLETQHQNAEAQRLRGRAQRVVGQQIAGAR